VIQNTFKIARKTKKIKRKTSVNSKSIQFENIAEFDEICECEDSKSTCSLTLQGDGNSGGGCGNMWQVLTVPGKWGDAFDALLRYAQHSLNFFFCPM
jgi:hypothetical protein